MKKVGFVGGIGPSSTVEYYLGYIDRTRKYYGENVYPEIVIDSVDLHKATEYFTHGEWDESAKLMIKSVTNLQQAGAEIAAITANTEHIVWDGMKDSFSIPVISIVDAVVDEVIKKGYKKVLIFGTIFTMESGLYEKAFKEKGIHPILPSDEDKRIIGDLIYPNLENGVIISEDRTKMLALAEKYMKETEADALLLGCTELPLIIKEGDISIPILDSTEIHINAIFEKAITT